MPLSSVVALLQAVMMLITLVQHTPNLPLALKNEATAIAQEAITVANAQLTATSSPVSSPVVVPATDGGYTAPSTTVVVPTTTTAPTSTDSVPSPTTVPVSPVSPTTTPTSTPPATVTTPQDTYLSQVLSLTSGLTRGNWWPALFIESYNQGLTQEKYSYAPAVVRIGSTDHVFTCANSQSGVFRDEIDYTPRDSVTGQALASTVPALTPSTLGSNLWDQQHICDPSVIALKTHFQGQDFSYAMFYTATAKGASEYNQIGVAFAKDITGPWVKYTYPLVYYPGVPMLADNQHVDMTKESATGAWGVGEPTATAVNDHEFLLAYDVGDQNGTRIEVRNITITDLDTSGPQASDPRVLSLSNGDAMLGGPLMNLDMAYDPASQQMLLVTDRFYSIPNKPAPTFISDAIQVGSIPGGNLWGTAPAQWKQIGLLDLQNDGSSAQFRRHFTGGIVRNIYGGLPNASQLEMYWASSCTVESLSGIQNACPAGLTRPEFTYEIWKSTLPISLGQ